MSKTGNMSVEELEAALRVARLEQQLAAARAGATKVQTNVAASGKKEKTKTVRTEEATAAVVQTPASAGAGKKVPTVKCKFGNSCNNMKCNFKHPGTREGTEESKTFVPRKLCSYYCDCDSLKNNKKCTFKHVDPSDFLPEDVGDEKAFAQVMNYLIENNHYQGNPVAISVVRNAVCGDQMTDEEFGNWMRLCHGNKVWVENDQINIKGFAPGKKRSASEEEKTDESA